MHQEAALLLADCGGCFARSEGCACPELVLELLLLDLKHYPIRALPACMCISGSLAVGHGVLHAACRQWQHMRIEPDACRTGLMSVGLLMQPFARSGSDVLFFSLVGRCKSQQHTVARSHVLNQACKRTRISYQIWSYTH